VECLEKEGVHYVFGVPGEEIEDLLFALADSSIVFVPCRHEQGAAFIADVWGRLTGKAGVCLATLGPGALNLATGAAFALLGASGLSAAASAGLDLQLDTVQYGAVQTNYNWDCCGVSIEYRRFSLGSARNENQYRFNFTLAGVGTAGNLRRAERLF